MPSTLSASRTIALTALLFGVALPGCFLSGRSLLETSDGGPSDTGPFEAGMVCNDGGGVQCGAMCVNVTTDPENCGACGRRCPTGRTAAPACVDGRCTLACPAGRGDCDDDLGTECETVVNTVENCGACGVRCQGGAGLPPTCANGRCTLICPAGRGDCDGNPANGCEADLGTDPRNCGACATACPAGTNQSATCESGRCGTACRAGFLDCNRDPRDGCEGVGLCL